MNEQVLIVERAALFDGNWPHGFVPLERDDVPAWVDRIEARSRFVDRESAERTPAWKQIIPYCVVRRGASELFCVERLPAQGEARLHGKLSIGIGGHINPVDAPTAGIVARATSRELHEELVLPGWAAPRPVGLLNDDSTAVGSVHFGLVHIVELPADTDPKSVAVREIHKMRGGFRGLVGPGQLWQDAALLESWSALLLDAFLRPMGRMRSSTSEGSHPSNPPEEGQHGGAQDA